MMRPKRISLAFKVNVMVVVLVLYVSTVLIMISEHAYQQAAINPYIRQLEKITVPADELKPPMQQLIRYLHADKLKQLRSEYDEEKIISKIRDWFLDEPSYRPAPYSLADDWVDIDTYMYATQQINNLSFVRVVAEKDGKGYEIGSEQDGTVLFENLRNFGQIHADDALDASGYASPAFLKTSGRNELIRCITISLENGYRGQIWLAYDLQEEARQHDHFLLQCILLTVFVTIFASTVTALLMRRYVIRPVRFLAQATKEFVPEADGTYSPDRISRVQIRNRDEIGDLSRDIRQMQESIVENTGNLALMTAERERVNTEMQLAASIQADALPSVFPAFPDHPEIDIYATMTPATLVGGDFYDFFLTDETHLGLVMADVSDKGVPAALFMMTAKTLIQNYAMMGLSPAQVLQAVNEQICKSSHQDMFVTVWFGILDLTTGRIIAGNAGHEYPALMPAGRTFDLIRDKHCFVIGGKQGIEYREYELELAPGAKLFLYTDGLPEARNAEGEMFGLSRMARALKAESGHSPEQILANMQKAVNDFVKDAAQSDDLTMLCLEYKGGGPGEAV